MPSLLSVVIATYRRPDILGAAIDSVVASRPVPLELLIIDGDPEGSAKPVVDGLPDDLAVPVTWLAAPTGLTRQRNAGLDAARGDVVVFIDDDARLEPDALAVLAQAYDDPEVVGATGRVLEPASNRVGGKTSSVRDWLPGGGQEGGFTRYGYPRRLVREDVDQDVSFMAGCFMSTRTEAGRRLRFDEALPGYGLAEDEDFGCRLARVGRVRYVAAAVVHHDNRGAGTRDSRAFSRQVVVNRHYLFRKNFEATPRARAGFAGLIAVLVAHRLANRDLRGVRGLVDGLSAVRSGDGTMTTTTTTTS